MPVTVRVGFSTSNRLVSRIIRLVTKSKVSHTWLLVSDSFLGTDMVMQATMGGFQMLSYDAFRKHHKIVKIFTINYPVQAGVQKATQWLGFRYDYLGLFGAAFVILGRWFKRKWKNPFNDSGALFCSEVVTSTLTEGGLPRSKSLDPSAVDPELLMGFLATHEDVTVFNDGDG